MPGMGPPPKPADQRRRRNATVATTKLPAGGRTGPPPPWPLRADSVSQAHLDTLQRRLDDAELTLVDEGLTARRRAAAIKKRDAALTDRNLLKAQIDLHAQAEAELWTELWATPQAAAWERLGWTREVAQYVRWKARAEDGNLDAAKEARQLADRLGLSPLAMLRLRWEVAADEVGEQRTRKAPATARARLRVIDPEAARDVAGS